MEGVDEHDGGHQRGGATEGECMRVVDGGSIRLLLRAENHPPLTGPDLSN
jgi:hypothetical protein